MDSNHRPHHYEWCALTAELRSRARSSLAFPAWPSIRFCSPCPTSARGATTPCWRRSSGGLGAGPLSRPPQRSRPRPLGVHRSPLPRASWRRRSLAPGARGGRADRRERLAGRAPARGRARRDAGGLPRRASSAAPPAPRRSRPPPWWARSCRCRCSSTASWPPGPSTRERAALAARRPGRAGRRASEAGELEPDYGPARPHPTAGAVLAAARPPLVAFNVDLATDDVELARRDRRRAARVGRRLPGVRAIGLYLEDRGRAQVSTNVHDHRAVPLRERGRVRARAGAGGRGRAGGPGAARRPSRAFPRTCRCGPSTPSGT